MKRLCVTGALHLDVLVTAPNLPGVDETVTGSGLRYVFGGKGGNQAMAADWLGAEVYFAGRLGADAFGQMLEAELAASTIDLSQLQRDDGASGMSVAIVDAKGDYGAVIVSEANLRINTALMEVRKDTGILLLQNEVPEEVNLTMARKARSTSAEVWLNAAPARPIASELLDQVDLLILNRVEAGHYAGRELASIDAAMRAADDLRSPEMSVIITLGPDGVIAAWKDGGTGHLPGFKVDVRSTHGAGDVFAGALATATLAGQARDRAVTFAQGAAALHVSGETRPTCEAVERFIATQPSR